VAALEKLEDEMVLKVPVALLGDCGAIWAGT
jgi:hypothetical protein